LVTRSGIANPTVHLLITAADSLLAQFIQAEEAAVGINVVIDTVDGATLMARIASGNYDTWSRGTPGHADVDGNVYQFVATTGTRNNTGYSNPRLDLILANARKATSANAQKTLWHAAFQILHDDRPIIFLNHPIVVAAVSNAITGVQFYADHQLRVQNA